MSQDKPVLTDYDQGFLDGVRAYAWYKDGRQEVGTTGRTLKEALERFRDTWNYQPPAPHASGPASGSPDGEGK